MPVVAGHGPALAGADESNGANQTTATMTMTNTNGDNIPDNRNYVGMHVRVFRYACCISAIASAYLCSRLFAYVPHSLRVLPTELVAWPHMITVPLQFELVSLSWPLWWRVMVNSLWNALLIVQFGICHVGCARPWVYRRVGPRYHRVVFMWVTAFSYHIIMILWRHQRDIIVWDFSHICVSFLSWVMGISIRHELFVLLSPAISIPLIVLCVSTVFKLDILYFIGVRQIMMTHDEEHAHRLQYDRDQQAKHHHQQQYQQFTKSMVASASLSEGAVRAGAMHMMKPIQQHHQHQQDFGVKQLKVTGMYDWVRHPMYLWLQSICFIAPIMSWDRLWYGICTTILLLIGLPFEERKLLREFGHQYAEYQQRTPMLFPLPSLSLPSLSLSSLSSLWQRSKQS